ncbi:ubiquinol-cytochrome c reductase iron-sulfur subunit [Lactarius quietus]|nr:ubiquinol-cytochrome c reductase iron-sulfur subunit [Lactarius quietus]
MAAASLQAAKKYATLPPTVRTLASGVPNAPSLNLDARAHDAHHHGGRSDMPSKWAGGYKLSSSSLVNKSFATVPTTGVFQQRTMHISAPRRDAPEVPDLSAYQASSASSNRALSYFMIGSMGVLSASVAKSSVTEFLGTMSASADVLALAKVEVELASIPEGKNAIIKWRGKPVFIRHRTQQEVDEARQVDWKGLRDPQSDETRVKKPEWLVMLGVCTHLGCVPIGESGDFGGWSVFFWENMKFCPCHGSHYDISGRIRKGPAPLNLEVPAHDFNEAEGKLIIG